METTNIRQHIKDIDFILPDQWDNCASTQQ